MLPPFLSQVLILNLQNCNLSRLDMLSQMHSVQFLNLSQNPKLEVDFSRMPHLQELYLSRNSLHEVPPALLSLPHLELLDLTRNKIGSFECL